MTPMIRPTRLALAGALALAAAQAGASIRMAEAFDGNWYNPAQDGRGVLVDYIPNANGTGGTFFAATFIYDNAGNPLWITLQDSFSEFQSTSGTVGIFRTSAGTWSTTAPAANTRIGTATVALNTCNSMTVALDMDASTGLADQTLTLQRIVPSTAATCAWQEAFTACPSFATPAPAFGPRACLLPPTINGDRTLTNNITWVMQGKVGVGTDVATGGTAATLRIEPGTLLVSTAAANSFDHLAVNRGSKIFAEGSRRFPIIMTTGNELPGAPGAPAAGQLGGLVLSGQAPANCNPNCVAEWDNTNRYGGTNAADSSGVVRYMQVRYAGYVFAANRELNSFTFNAVGSGTVLEYLQAWRGADDGFEWFGGTANVRYAVVTCPGDDAFDWDEGFTGKMQFAVLEQGGCAGEDHGFELSNSPTNADASPRARGLFANVTLRGAATGSNRDGIQLNSGTGGNFYNILVQGFRRSCVQVAGAPTANAAGDPGVGLTGVLTGQNIRTFGCATNTTDGSGAPAGFTAAWFAGQGGNAVLGASALQATGVLPNGVAPSGQFPPTGSVPAALNDWFVPTDYVGAFRSDAPADNWMLGWTRPL